MTDPDQARATQLKNIQAKTGQDLPTLCKAVAASGKTKHGEVRAWLMETYGLGYGDANGLATYAARSTDERPAGDGADPLAEIYAGKKAPLRALHDAVLTSVAAFGEFEVAPKKAYVSLRRRKQFATVGPKASDRLEIGINLKDDVASPRVVAVKPGGMCQYALLLAGPEDIDDEVRAVLRRAFDAAG